MATMSACHLLAQAHPHDVVHLTSNREKIAHARPNYILYVRHTICSNYPFKGSGGITDT